MNKTFIIAGNFDLIQLNAAGKRVLGLGRILKALGYGVAFMGISNETGKHYPPALDGSPVFNVPYPRGARSWLNVNEKYKAFLDVAQNIGMENLAGVIVYGTPSLSFWVKKVCRWARKSDLVCLADVVDWIEWSGKGVCYDFIKYLDTNYQKRFAVLHATGVITISSYLYDYYTSKGKTCLQIPPVFDSSAITPPVTSGVRKFIYTGYPFTIKADEPSSRFKDRLDLSVEAFYAVARQDKEFLFEIFGLTREEYLIVLPQHRSMLDALAGKVVFYGKVPAAEVQKSLIESDFTILQRDDKLMTLAGFPTKVAESIASGVPVVCNLTSNIGDYIKDGFNGVLLSGDSPEKDLLRAIEMPDEKLATLKQNCRNKNPFDYLNFVSSMREFLDTLSCKKL